MKKKHEMPPHRRLTEQDAVQIYSGKALGLSRAEIAALADAYGASIETVRQIWRRRTWAYATRRLWLAPCKKSVDDVLSEAELLPLDDPFADDWAHWQAARGGCACAEYIHGP